MKKYVYFAAGSLALGALVFLIGLSNDSLLSALIALCSLVLALCIVFFETEKKSVD